MKLVRDRSPGVFPRPNSGEEFRGLEGHTGHSVTRGLDMTAVICGSPSCERPGLIWLEEHDVAEYSRGSRIIDLLRTRTKVRAACSSPVWRGGSR